MIRAAATTFDLTVDPGQVSHNLTKAAMTAIHGPLKTTVLLLRDGASTVCLVTPNVGGIAPPFYRTIQRCVARAAGVEPGQVLVFYSHNHCAPPLAEQRNWTDWGDADGEPVLTACGQQFLEKLEPAAASLPKRLEPVSIRWAQGRENRISYCRKGYRADGSSYFMREEDRLLVADDFRGDIDDQASVVKLTGEAGQTVAWLAHFSAHPVTAYHPERPIVHPEYCGIACELLAGAEGAPVAFLQGCCGDVNSKGLLSGDTARAEWHGRLLGESWLAATAQLRPSQSDRLGLVRRPAVVPFAPLPPVEELLAEKAEIEDFLQRARAGDEDTLSCVGLNFPRALSPVYRAALVDLPARWNAWALAQHEAGTANSQPDGLAMEVCVVRLGDIGIGALPCEPFTAIGRRMRALSPMALTLPCGYCNYSYGYLPDAGNVGGNEYMSAFYRYCRRPAFRAPAGSVLADAVGQGLRQLAPGDD